MYSPLRRETQRNSEENRSNGKEKRFLEKEWYCMELQSNGTA